MINVRLCKIKIESCHRLFLHLQTPFLPINATFNVDPHFRRDSKYFLYLYIS